MPTTAHDDPALLLTIHLPSGGPITVPLTRDAALQLCDDILDTLPPPDEADLEREFADAFRRGFRGDPPPA